MSDAEWSQRRPGRHKSPLPLRRWRGETPQVAICFSLFSHTIPPARLFTVWWMRNPKTISATRLSRRYTFSKSRFKSKKRVVERIFFFFFTKNQLDGKRSLEKRFSMVYFLCRSKLLRGVSRWGLSYIFNINADFGQSKTNSYMCLYACPFHIIIWAWAQVLSKNETH